MTKQTQPELLASLSELSVKRQKKVLREFKKANRLAGKHNRLLEKQHRQAQLDYELAERQYLIDKSALQPTFRLTVTEFLTTKPDFVNDPEQASEAKFLTEHGVGEDQRALRFRLEAKGGSATMRPSIVTKLKHSSDNDERIYAMSELIYFIDVESLDLDDSDNSAIIYFVYRDRTTLPVLHKYRLTPRADSTLLRWDATHLDTVYANSKQATKSLRRYAECAALFSN